MVVRSRRIALLIPVYQDTEGLGKSVSTLPTEIALDIIIVDDGSDTPLTIPSVPFPHRVFLLRHRRNLGIEYALNTGIEWALKQGYTYLARLDAGDVAWESRFVKQVAFLEEHREYGVVGGQIRVVDNQERELYREVFPEKDSIIRKMMHLRNCFAHPAVMFRTNVFRVVGVYSREFPAAEDYELFFRIMQQYKVANLPDRVLTYRVESNGISLSRRRTQISSRLRVMIRYFDPNLPESYLGIIRSLVSLLFPTRLWLYLKIRKGDRWPGGK